MRHFRKGRPLAFLAVLATVLAVLLVFAPARAEGEMLESWIGTNNDGTITVTGAANGTVMTIYKVAEIVLESGTPTTKPMSGISPDVLSAYLSSQTDETVSALESEAEKNLSPVVSTASSFSGLGAGLYVLTADSADSSTTYQTMVIPINVSSDGATWEKDVTVAIKSSTVTPDEEAQLDIEIVEDHTSGSGVQAGESFTAKITFTIPSTYEDGTEVDQWALRLMFPKTGIDYVWGGNYDRTLTVIGPNGAVLKSSNNDFGITTVSGGSSSTSFALTFNGGQVVYGTYTVSIPFTVKDTATTGTTYLQAWSGKNVVGDYELQEIYQLFTTFRIVKRDAADTGKGLSGAVFELYADEDCMQRVKDVSGTDVTITSGDGGWSTVDHGILLKPGTYYLKEITAPDGYSLPADPTAISLERGEEFRGTYGDTFEIYNAKKAPFSELPSTGDVGGALVVLTGVLLVAGSVVLVRRSR